MYKVSVGRLGFQSIKHRIDFTLALVGALISWWKERGRESFTLIYCSIMEGLDCLECRALEREAVNHWSAQEDQQRSAKHAMKSCRSKLIYSITPAFGLCLRRNNNSR